MQSLTDEELISRALHDDRTALETLITRYLPVVHRRARYMLHSAEAASDATQDTFVKVWKHLNSFQSGRPVRPWIMAIAHRTCLDHAKKKLSIPFSAFDTEDEEFIATLADPSPHPDVIIDTSILSELAARALSLVSPLTASIIYAHTYEGHTFAHIARKTNESLHTIKSRYRRGIAHMRKILTTK